MKFFTWLSNFDVAKAVTLAIFAVLGSWYDLKSEVKVQKVELTNYVQQSNIRFSTLETDQHRTEEDVRGYMRDIREDLRELRKGKKS